ncbi:MAG: hypothetical protein ACPKM0_08135 [Pleomorphochaeta sp.]
MKKTLTILAISAIALTSVFAKSAQVQLNTSIEETEVSYQLSYKDTDISNGSSDFEIGVAALTQDGKTDLFSVNATSNQNDDMAVKVKVTPTSFSTTLNDGKKDFDSEITPKVNTEESISILEAGKHDDLLVNSFYLSWEGNSELPAGKYVSDVKIVYSIE